MSTKKELNRGQRAIIKIMHIKYRQCNVPRPCPFGFGDRNDSMDRYDVYLNEQDVVPMRVN